MRRDLINEDSNQFGPGTDLVICLLALLLILVMIVSFLYNTKKTEFELVKKEIENSRVELDLLKRKLGEFEEDGKFKLAIGKFDAATFKQRPSTKELTNPEKTEAQVLEILGKYNDLSDKYPYIFVIGHANKMSKFGENLTDEERFEFNWGIAGERSAVIANLLQKHLQPEQKNYLILVSTGELDLKNPEDPTNEENAFVEVVFGKEWKIN